MDGLTIMNYEVFWPFVIITSIFHHASLLLLLFYFLLFFSIFKVTILRMIIPTKQNHDKFFFIKADSDSQRMVQSA